MTTNLPAEVNATKAVQTVNVLSFDDKTFGRAMQLADMMSRAKNVVPAHYNGQPGSCLAVICQAMRWNMDPFSVAQKTHVINGTIGYEAQLVNAVLSSMGAIKGRPSYSWSGPWDKVSGKKSAPEVEKACTVTVTVQPSDSDEPVSLTLSLSQASVRNSPLWETDPKQQLAYLAVKRMARLYFPDALLGVYTPDELEETRTQTSETPRVSAAERLAVLDDPDNETEAAVIDADPVEQATDYSEWAREQWAEMKTFICVEEIDDWEEANRETLERFRNADPERYKRFMDAVSNRRQELEG